MITELRPRKDLLDSKFNGYKLSLDSIPVYRQCVTEGADHVFPSEDQYSFAHTKLFSLHNHLFGDPWHDNTVYFVDKTWKLYKASVNSETGRVDGLEAVFVIPGLETRKTGHFNVSLLFPGPQLAVLADGCGKIYILYHGNDTQWQLEMSQAVKEVVGVDGEDGSVLVSARLAPDMALHCVLMTLQPVTQQVADSSEQSSRSDKPRPALVNTVLHWITFHKAADSEAWLVSGHRRIEGPSCIDYVALEVSCSALYVASTANFKFTFDSFTPLPPTQPEEQTKTAQQKPVYTWKQSEDDINVTVDLDSGVTRDDVEVVVKAKELALSYKQTTIVAGPLTYDVDTDLTTWSLQPGRLELTLSKQKVGQMWPELVLGDQRGCQIIDQAVVEEVHSRLSHLCSDTEVQEEASEGASSFNLEQLEECDCAPEDSGSMVRLDTVTHSVSHQISLVGHQWLFAVDQSPDRVPSMCVRHDVDGCVWRLDPPADGWPCEHIGTFCALGYVAASKTQKKFIVAASDLSYTVICETNSRVFVYRKASLVDGELRNRKSSARFETVAKQQLINLESQAPVLGALATNTHLFVLTSDTLYSFHIQ